MFKILKGGWVYDPANKGKQDILIAGGVIANIAERIDPALGYGETEVIDVREKYVVPGFLDQHVHLIGGGGEGGFATRTPEIALSSITAAGITTVVGCLGTDGTTRHVASLLAKARGLESEGISAYIYTGAYEVPTQTITKSVREDIILIDKVLGCGEIAISDHRSAEPSKQEIVKLAAEARVGGLLSGKAGILHLHVGSGKRKLSMLFEILDESDIPATQFAPTHLSRTAPLLDDAVRFARMGGRIDFTAGESLDGQSGQGIKPAQAVQYCLKKGVELDRITMSSDGNGSMPFFNEKGELKGLRVAQPSSLYAEFKDLVKEAGLPLSDALLAITANPARGLKLYPRKGALKPGCDADLIVLDQDLNIEYVFAGGCCHVRDGKAVIKGTFE